MSLLLASTEQSTYQNTHGQCAYHACRRMLRYVFLGVFKKMGDRVAEFAKLSLQPLYFGGVLRLGSWRDRFYTRGAGVCRR